MFQCLQWPNKVGLVGECGHESTASDYCDVNCYGKGITVVVMKSY